MAKRRLADLLQEEAKKIPTPSQDAVIDITATEVTKKTEATELKDELDKENSLISENTEVDDNGDDKNHSKRGHLTKADLETTVKELNESLAQSREQEIELQQEIERLQSALLEQQAQAQHLAKELKDAKTAAVHLAEANSQLTNEIADLKEANAQLEKTTEQFLQEKQAREKPQPPKETNKPVPYYRKSYHRSPDRLQVPPRKDEPAPDNSSQMWLLD